MTQEEHLARTVTSLGLRIVLGTSLCSAPVGQSNVMSKDVIVGIHDPLNTRTSVWRNKNDFAEEGSRRVGGLRISDYIKKPFDNRDFLVRIRKALEHRDEFSIY